MWNQCHQLAVTPSQDGNLLGRRATVDLLADLLCWPLAHGQAGGQLGQTDGSLGWLVMGRERLIELGKHRL